MKLKYLFFTAAVFCLLAAAPVFASDTSITTDSAVLKNDVITVSGKILNPVSTQQITILATDATGDVYNYESPVYLDQIDAVLDRDGGFTYSFNAAGLSGDKVYIVRIGGTDIDVPAQMVVLSSDEGEKKLLLGDADLDGKITANDAAITLEEVIFHLDSITEEQREAMKVTKSDIITSNNAALIFYKAYNSTYKFPAEE